MKKKDDVGNCGGEGYCDRISTKQINCRLT